MRRLTVLVLLAALVLPLATANGIADGGTISYEVFLVREEHLFAVTRTHVQTPHVGRACLRSLLRGPTAAELASGVTTSIPEGTELLGLSIDEGIATVDLSSEYASGGGSLSTTLRLAQMVWSITQWESVRGVELLLDGEVVDLFSGEGLVLPHPMRRGHFTSVAPLRPIAVDAPLSGERVSSPVTVSGTALVFEGSLLIRIRNQRGTVIARGRTTAEGGGDERGAFRVELRFWVRRTQPGTVRVLDIDPVRRHPVEVPVVLVAG
jgi:hypothetical protein